MPRSRGSEIPQRQSPRGSHPLRTVSSDSDPLHHRPITDRSPKIGDRRSPRGSQGDSVNQKKLGTRIADLESQLGQAQEELKILKHQLSSAEAAKKEVQQELEKKTTKPTSKAAPVVEIEKKHPKIAIEESTKKETASQDEVLDENPLETDVFEVIQQNDRSEDKANPVNISIEQEKSSVHDSSLKVDEINLLKSKLEDKEKETKAFNEENESLKIQLDKASSQISSVQAREEEMAMKMRRLEEELVSSKDNSSKLSEKLKTVEEAKEVMELEMKKLRVQTEQWRKAADAAAAVLAGDAEMNGRISERCGSMDKHFQPVFQTPASGYAGLLGSPGMADEFDDGFGSGKRKGSGIKMFGDLWKKKSQK